MSSGVFTVFGRGKVKKRKRSKITREMRKPGVSSPDLVGHAIKWDGKHGLVGWQMFSRK